jgi:hypothetical protein
VIHRPSLWLLALLLPSCQSAAPELPPAPRLHRGHAHNDYLHGRALLDALDHGFQSAEADVFLIDGELRVGHERSLLRQGTLQSLYLEPLRQRTLANGGSVQPGGATFTLLIDIKQDGAAVYKRLKQVLASYRDMLTVFRDDGIAPGAVSVILSGDRPKAQVAAERERLCAIDGRPQDLEGNPSPYLVPWISDAWTSHFGRDAVELDAAQRAHLAEIVAKAHSQGRVVRFWGAPDREEVWAQEREAGVDLINTDRLADFERWAAR